MKRSKWDDAPLATTALPPASPTRESHPQFFYHPSLSTMRIPYRRPIILLAVTWTAVSVGVLAPATGMLVKKKLNKHPKF